MKTKQELIEKARTEWGETWDEGMIEYNAEYNEYIVWVGKPDIYKAFFDADTLNCIGLPRATLTNAPSRASSSRRRSRVQKISARRWW